jgi:hypothetical protein
MRQKKWATKQSPSISAQTIENCCCYLDCIVMCGLMSLQMFLLWKCSVQFAVKPPSLVKSTWLLNKGPSSHCHKNHCHIFCAVEQMVQVQQLTVGNPRHCHMHHMFWIQKSTLRFPLSLKPYSCSTITTALARNCVLIGIFLEYVVVHFKKRLTTQPWRWRDITSLMSHVNVWDALIITVNTIILCYAVEWGR